MNTIIYISGLQTVPEDVYEASMLDGAGKWKQFWKVTFPLVMPFVINQSGAQHKELPHGI